MKKKIIRTCTGITKLQALKQLKHAAALYKKEVAKILRDNDLFYCEDVAWKNRITNCNRSVDNMINILIDESADYDWLKHFLMTRKEALEAGFY